MALNSQTALLDLIESYLQDLRSEAETLSTVARLINQSIESRRQIMEELEAYFTNRRPAHATDRQPMGPSQGVHGHPAWAGMPRADTAARRADTLLRDLDTMMNAQAHVDARAWPTGYHS